MEDTWLPDTTELTGSGKVVVAGVYELVEAGIAVITVPGIAVATDDEIADEISLVATWGEARVAACGDDMYAGATRVGAADIRDMPAQALRRRCAR